MPVFGGEGQSFNPRGGFLPGVFPCIICNGKPRCSWHCAGAMPSLNLKSMAGTGTVYTVLPQKERKNHMNMKKIFALILSFAVVLGLLAGCGGNGGGAIDKNRVVIAIGDEPTTLDPTNGWGHGNAPIMQSTLVRYDADMNFVNDLAAGYTLSEDGLVWTFKIREDAFFTDGEQVNAHDVAFTLETAKAAKGSIDLTFMDTAVAEDDFTVVITLNTPTFWFLNTLASVGIVPEHAYSEEYGVNPAVTSGPYKFVEWRRQEQLVLEANEGYYGEIPAIKTVVIVFMGEDAALAAVRAGRVDAAITSATLAVNRVNGYHIERVATADCRGFTLPVSGAEGKVAQNGALYWNKNSGNLAKLIESADKLAENERTALGENARKRIDTEYNWQKIADSYQNIFRI